MSVDEKRVAPCAAVRGNVRVSGDKSISHRLAMLAAVAEGRSVIHGFLQSSDCLNTLRAMQTLGAAVEWHGPVLSIHGTGGKLRQPGAPLDLGNSGTGMRLLTGLLAGYDLPCELSGDESLLSRPMGRIRDPLAEMGAQVDLLGATGCGPVRLHGGRLKAIAYELPVASAQVKSCVLLAGLRADGRTRVIEPRPSRDHTERLLGALGVDLDVNGPVIELAGGQALRAAEHAGEWTVPGDFSSAAFWMTAAACRPGSEVTVRDVGLNPRRTALAEVLSEMGAGVARVVSRDAGWESVGDLRVSGSRLRASTVGGDRIPNLIDELPLVAVAGALGEGRTVIRDAAELRVKESDRIATTARLLRAFGIEVEERADGMTVTGCGGRLPSTPSSVDSGGDHRIAMAAAVLATMAAGVVTIAPVGCVDTSYPAFWDDLASLCRPS